MSKDTAREGWHTFYGYEVWVDEDGLITHGISGDRRNRRTVYPYRRARCKGYDGWDRLNRISPEAFRSGIRRGTIRML